jgi:hypothetical protein
MLKSSGPSLSKTWTVVRRHGASYTGGTVSVTHDGSRVACLCDERVALLNLDTGLVERLIPSVEEVRACPSPRFRPQKGQTGQRSGWS